MAHRGRMRQKRLSRFTIFGVIVLTAVLCCTMAYKNNALKAESAEYMAQITELQEQKKSLDQEKESLSDEKTYVKSKEYVEDVAREKLGLVYSDEIIFKPAD